MRPTRAARTTRTTLFLPQQSVGIGLTSCLSGVRKKPGTPYSHDSSPVAGQQFRGPSPQAFSSYLPSYEATAHPRPRSPMPRASASADQATSTGRRWAGGPGRAAPDQLQAIRPTPRERIERTWRLAGNHRSVRPPQVPNVSSSSIPMPKPSSALGRPSPRWYSARRDPLRAFPLQDWHARAARHFDK